MIYMIFIIMIGIFIIAFLLFSLFPATFEFPFNLRPFIVSGYYKVIAYYSNIKESNKHKRNNSNSTDSRCSTYTVQQEQKELIKKYIFRSIRNFNTSRMSTVEDIKIQIQAMDIRIVVKPLFNNIGGYARCYTYPFEIGIDPSCITFSTVAHEVSHLIDYQIRGNSYHDNFWERINLSCGGSEYLSEIYEEEQVTRMPHQINERKLRNQHKKALEEYNRIQKC